MRNDRLSGEALVVVLQAHREAVSLRTGYIGPEHLLLAIYCRGGVALLALDTHGITYDRVRQKIEEINGPGTCDEKTLRRTPQFEQIYRLSLQEAMKDGMNKVAIQHLLNALLLDGDSVACQVIESLGTEIGELQRSVYDLTHVPGRSDTTPPETQAQD